jgi:hypothetical protein
VTYVFTVDQPCTAGTPSGLNTIPHGLAWSQQDTTWPGKVVHASLQHHSNYGPSSFKLASHVCAGSVASSHSKSQLYVFCMRCPCQCRICLLLHLECAFRVIDTPSACDVRAASLSSLMTTNIGTDSALRCFQRN